MAKKTRTPPPPRRVQAPKRRDTSTPTIGARPPAVLYAVAASGILLLAAVILFLVLRGGGGDGGESAAVASLRQAGCTYRKLPGQGRKHVATLNAKPKWNSFPPTSGDHYFQPVIFDRYDAPVSQLQVVHNLEHGGVAIQYGNRVPAADIERIGTFYLEDANALIVAPLPSLGDKIALTAWTRIATCEHFDGKAFGAFRDAFRYKGPERFPPEALQPGQ